MSFFRGRNTVTRADKISNFTVNTAEYGAAVMEVLGTTRLSGNVIYYDDFTAHEHRESVRTGKGGKSKSTSITYTYTVAVILGLCEGEISGIGRVWKDKTIYTYPNDELQLTMFKGAQSQGAWPYLTSKHPDKALPYTGLAYMAGVIDLGDSGSLPAYNFEVKGKLLSTGDGIDVNPADYMSYILNKVGQGDVIFNGLDDFRSYCANADILVSTPMDKTGTVATREIINELATLCNAYIFWSNDAYKIVPLENRTIGNWTPDNTIKYDLTNDDFIPQNNGACVTYSRKDSSAIYNRWTVEFLNRENGYEKESVSYENVADIAQNGVRQAPTLQAGYIYTKERAVKIAENIARRNTVEQIKYTFKLDWAFCRLEPGDKVRITDEVCGVLNQVVLIDSVTEDRDGMLLLTAISWFDGNYSAAAYDVHEVDRPFVDFNAQPGNTATPSIFQPPADLTRNGLEVWIAAKGTTDRWGGCAVYVSDDNENYRILGQISNTARIGKLTSGITAGAISLTVQANGTFLSGTAQDAERGNTLLWIDGECMSYTTATLNAGGTYTLSGLVRGQYNTQAVSHAGNATMVRCDAALLKAPFAKEDVGKHLWFKFCSYNIFGAGEQSLAEVQAYEYTLQPYYIPAVRNIRAHNRYRQLADGVSRYDIVVDWDVPELQSYLQGDVWYKTNHAQAAYTKIQPGTKADELGFLGDWIFGGSGKNQVVVPQAIVGDTYRIAVCTKDEWGAVTSPDTAPRVDILVALKTTIPNTPDNFAISFSAEAVASWNEVVNTDIMYYEVRTDTNPGVETQSLLARTNNLSAALPLTSRTGTLYLYARSAIGKYSAPAVLTYNKPAPPKPNPPELKAMISGFSAKTDPIPAGCVGMVLYIDGYGLTTIRSGNNAYTYACPAGIYDVKAAFFDLFGEGEQSEESRIVVKDSVSAEMLEDEAVSLAKVNAAVRAKLDAGEMAGQSVVQIVSNLGNLATAKQNYTAFTQLDDAINLRVAKGDVINQINLSPTTTTIDGKYLHVTGQTVFDSNVIVNRMLQAGAVTADKISATSLSAICATVGLLRTATSGARMEIESNQLRVYDSNNKLRVRMGVW